MHDYSGWTKEKELAVINKKQADYVNQLIKILNSPDGNIIKTINFNSQTGTGKTNMMALLFNQMPDYFFVVTTLSRGQLNKQVETKIKQWAKFDNFLVYGLQDYTTATIRTAEDIIAQLPTDKPIIWIRDEGHINTNRWQEILQSRCKNIVNFSATNKIKNGIFCNFTETAMLRTPKQQNSSNPEDALKKLIEVKKQHKDVKNYNPCAIFRIFDESIVKEVIKQCQKYKLKYINITNNEDYIMSELCEDDNEYDVIINKLKIVEGIDIRRAHVLFMDNRPGNLATTIQMIGRCRRNALLWRDDIDIFAPENKQLLVDTRQCYIFYNLEGMTVAEKDGELLYDLCDTISVEELTVGAKIHVDKGVMPNGLSILELRNKTGDYVIRQDEETGFNYVDNPDFYRDVFEKQKSDLIYLRKISYQHKTVSAEDIQKNWIKLGGSINPVYHEVEKVSVKYSEIESELNKYVSKHGSWNKKLQFIGRSALMDKIANQKTILHHSIEEWKEALEKQKGDLICLMEPYYGSPEFKTRELDYWKKVLKERKSQKTPITKDETFNADIFTGYCISEMTLKTKLKSCIYNNCARTVNNKEIAIVGADKMKLSKNGWFEDSTVSSKLSYYSKLNRFISNKYKHQLETARQSVFNGENKFNFSKRYNSCLGYCVEYYAKYLLYGGLFLSLPADFNFKERIKESNRSNSINYSPIVRRCMDIYREHMKLAFGIDNVRLISFDCLNSDDGKEFVKTVVELGEKTAEFLRKELNITKTLDYYEKIPSSILGVNHISALCDVISKDKIIDIKVTNSITEKHIKQVLTYHWLSKFRDDVDIHEVIVYDAVSGKSVKIHLD